MKLYEISQEYRAALDDLSATDDMDPQAIEDTLGALHGEFMSKASAVAMYARTLRLEAEMIKSEAASMKARGDKVAGHADRLTKYLSHHLQAAGADTIPECPVRVRFQKNPPSVIITDPEKVPKNLLVTPPPPPPQVDKKSAKAMLSESGGESDWGRIEQTTRLVIGE